MKNIGLMQSRKTPDNLYENSPDFILLNILLGFGCIRDLLKEVTVVRVVHYNAKEKRVKSGFGGTYHKLVLLSSMKASL